jgi:hypothetical protein
MEGKLMTALDCLATLRRRWYVLALIGLCTVIGTWAVHQRSITWEACEGLYLSGPPAAANVYLNSDPSLAMTTGMVTQTMSSSAMQDKLSAAGATAAYSVTQTNTGEVRFPAYAQPTLQICANSTDPSATTRTISLATTEFRAVLHTMQSERHVPAKSYVVASILSPAQAAPITGKPTQAYLGVFLMGLISAVACTLWSDPLIAGWGRRRKAARTKQATATSDAYT